MRRSDESPFDPVVERELAAIDAALRGERVEPDLADLAELTRLLRDARPAIGDGFAASLDASADRGFRPAGEDAGGSQSRGRIALLRAAGFRPGLLPAMGLAASVLIALVVATSVLSGDEQSLNGKRSPQVATSRDADRQLASPEADVGKGGAGGGAGSIQSDEPPSANSIAPSPVPPGSDDTLPGRRSRSVEREANLALVAANDKIDEVARKVLRTTDALGGIVVSSNISTARGGGSATFELRVPSRRLEEALAKLSLLADVRSREQRSTDITTTVVSARDRLDEYVAERRSLLRQLANADSENETASIKARLRLVRQQIADARSALRRLGERTSYSVVHVTVESKDGSNSVLPGNGDDGWSVGDAWKDARRVLEVAAGVAIVAIAIAIPFGLVGAAGGFGGRRALRRRRERALDMAV